MSNTPREMRQRIEKFLNEHFPHDTHNISDYGYDMSVKVGEEPNPKLLFKVCGRSVHDIAIKSEYFATISPLFGIDTYSPTSTGILNDFFQTLNANSTFSNVFQHIEMIDFSKYVTVFSRHDDDYSDIYDANKKIILTSKCGKVEYRAIVQFAFVLTVNNTFKVFPAIALMPKTNCDFRVAFNLDAQTIHTITADGNGYEDFFEKNKLFDASTEIDLFMHSFVDDAIMKFNIDNRDTVYPFDAHTVSFEDKLELLRMIHI